MTTQYGKRRRNGFIHVAVKPFLMTFLGGLALLGAGYIGSAIGEQHAVGAPQLVSGAVVVAKAPVLPGFTVTWGGTGVLAVPAQVAPGTYVVSSDGGQGCLWQRLKRNDENVSSVLGKGQMSPGGAPQVVIIADTDRYLRLFGCAFRRVA